MKSRLNVKTEWKLEYRPEPNSLFLTNQYPDDLLRIEDTTKTNGEYCIFYKFKDPELFTRIYNQCNAISPSVISRGPDKDRLYSIYLVTKEVHLVFEILKVIHQSQSLTEFIPKIGDFLNLKKIPEPTVAELKKQIEALRLEIASLKEELAHRGTNASPKLFQ